MLFTLSAELLGAPGTEAGGREVVQQWLRDRSLYFDEFRLEIGVEIFAFFFNQPVTVLLLHLVIDVDNFHRLFNNISSDGWGCM